jgi:bla regulator protein BlaR1
MNLLQASITSAILIIVIAAVRALTKYSLPKPTFLALWAVVIVKLLIPYSVTSEFSVYNIVIFRGMNSVFRLTSFTNTSAGDIMTLVSLLLAGSGSFWNNPLSAVWLSGAAVFGLFFLGALIRYWKINSAALPVKSNETVAKWLEEQGLKRTIRVLVSDRLTTPIATGILRPKIILPKFMDLADKTQLTYVLTHELVHIRRFHALWKFLLIAAVCCHWFNPVVWLMYLLANRDLEHSCDEQVIRTFGQESKADYAMSLVTMAQRQRGLEPIGLGYLKSSAEQRIVSIMKYKRSKLSAGIFSVLLLICVTLSLATTSNSRFIKSRDLGGIELNVCAVYLGTSHHPYYYTNSLPSLFELINNSPAPESSGSSDVPGER